MANSISQAFKSLSFGGSEGVSEHRHIYEVLYQYLSNVASFSDKKALHNCLVALINLDKYHKAQDLLAQVPSEAQEDVVVEKAYIYYKTGNSKLLNELFKLQKIDVPTLIRARALTHIMAQNAYKEGQNDTALELYILLINTNQDIDSVQDLACNEAAVTSQANFMANSSVVGPQKDIDLLKSEKVNSSYDFELNAALIEISQGKFDAALARLDAAERLCSQTLDGDDLDDEITPIKLSKAYIHHLTGDKETASDILAQVAPSNSINKLVLNNNKQAIAQASRNDNLVLRILDYQPELHRLYHKLTQPQIQAITRNNLRLRFDSNTLNKTSSYFSNEFVTKWVSTFPGDLTPVLYKILLKLELDLDSLESNHKKYAKILFKWINSTFGNISNPHQSPEFVVSTLILIHVNSYTNNYNQSLHILENSVEKGDLNDLSLALVGSLFKIYESQGYQEKSTQLFTSLSDKILSQTSLNLQLYKLAKLVAFKLLLTDKSKANTIFSKLQSENKEDELVNAVLSGQSEGLLPVEKLAASSGDVESLLSVDVDELVDSKKARSTPVRVGKTKVVKPVSGSKKKAKFSAGKKLVPEDKFDPLSLDKERWLPMTLRSYYKPTKKDKKKGGHQGALVAETGKKKKKGKK